MIDTRYKINPFTGELDAVLDKEQIDGRLSNLEADTEIYKIFEDISGTTSGTVTMYDGFSVYLDAWDGSNNAQAYMLDVNNRPDFNKPLRTAFFIKITANVDINGNYTLSGTPTAENYCIVFIVSGLAEFGYNIPIGVIVAQLIEQNWLDNGTALYTKKNRDVDLQENGLKDDNVTTAIKLGDAQNTSFNTINKTILGAVNENKLKKESAIGTSLLYGGEISINVGDNSKFDISAGSAVFVDNYTDTENPTSTIIVWEAQTGVEVTNISSQVTTFVSIQQPFTIVQNNVPLNTEEYRTNVVLGVLEHVNGTFINSVGAFTQWGSDIIPLINDFVSVLGTRLTKSGNVFYANGSNLHINRTSGFTFSAGVNFYNDAQNPNFVSSSPESLITFFMGYRNTPAPTIIPLNEIPVDKYDPNGDGVLVDIPQGDFVTHRIRYAPLTKLTAIQYSQYSYDTMKKAVDACVLEDFETIEEVSEIPLRTILAVKRGATDLSDVDQAKFVELGALGDTDQKTIPNYSTFSSAINLTNGMSNERQVISFVANGGVLYADVGKTCNILSDAISFINSDSSINITGEDFTDCNSQVGDKITITGSTDNNGIFTIVSVIATKIVVSETITNESVGAAKIEFAGNGDIKFNLGEKERILDCTTASGVGGRARIALTAGSDTSPQENWVYVIKSGSTSILQQSTTEPCCSDYPDGFSVICSALIPSVATSTAYGFYNSRRWTDSKDIDGRGAVATILSKLRDNTNYKSGLGLTIDIDTAPNPDTGDITMANGTIREIYSQDINSLQLSINGALVVNDSTTSYDKITDLFEIGDDSTGATLTNRYYQLIIAVSLNTNGYVDRFLINVPNGSYSNAADAFNDINGYSSTSFPSEFKSAYLLGALVLRKGPATLSNEAIAFGVNYIDLRGKDLGTASSGAGTAAVTTFSDGDFAVYDDGDSTKKLSFQCSGITTGTTRTITMVDRDLDLANILLKNGLAGGQTINGGTLTTEILSLRNNIIDNLGFDIVSSGVFRSNITNYETLVLNDDDLPNKKYVDDGLDGKVNNTGSEIIYGVKAFNDFPVTTPSAPTTDYQVANKKYVDDNSGTVAHNDTTSKQGGGTNEYYHLDASDYNYIQGNTQLLDLWPTGSPQFERVNIQSSSVGVDSNTNGDLVLDTTKNVFSEKFIIGLGSVEGFAVKYYNTTHVTITAGYVEANSTYYQLSADTTHELESLASAFDVHYLYIDDSASTSPTPVIIDSIAEPVWSETKRGWYNGDDRCIGSVLSADGASTISYFNAYENGKEVVIRGLVGEDFFLANNLNPTGIWMDPTTQPSEFTPINATKVFVQGEARDVGTSCRWAITDYETGVVYASSVFDGAQGVGQSGYGSIYGTADVFFNSTRQIKIYGINDDDNQLTFQMMGYSYKR